MLFGFKSYNAYAEPVQQIKITTPKPSARLVSIYGSSEVYAEFTNSTRNTIYVSWAITARDDAGNKVTVASGNCTVPAGEKERTNSYSRSTSLSNYKIEWSYNN